MNDLPTLHFVANCVASFSFLTSAVLMALVHVPYAAMWSRLRKCKYYMSLVFLVVGLSCGKTVLFNLEPNTDILVTSTLISAGIQSLLFACTGITFVNPVWIKARWICANFMLIVLYSILLLLGLCVWKTLFWITAIVACAVYFAMLVSYQFVFYREYHHCVDQTDMLTDEYSESRYVWIKHFFMAVSILGVTAGIAPFLPTQIYDVWMLAAASFYAFVVISFVNYCGSTAQLVRKVFDANSAVDFNRMSDTADDLAFSRVESQPLREQLHSEDQNRSLSATIVEQVYFDKIDSVLQPWVENLGFVKNDLMSENFAHSLGVSVPVLRTYFSHKYQMDFRQWRTKLRIDYACAIIREHPDYSYDTIAEMVGICDRANFTRSFKKNTGMTPKEYADKCKVLEE